MASRLSEFLAGPETGWMLTPGDVDRCQEMLFQVCAQSLLETETSANYTWILLSQLADLPELRCDHCFSTLTPSFG
jgi:hypothetical protein